MLVPKMEKTANPVVRILETPEDIIKHEKTTALQNTSNINKYVVRQRNACKIAKNYSALLTAQNHNKIH